MKKRFQLWLFLFGLTYFSMAQEKRSVTYAISAQPLHSWMLIHSKSIEKYRGTTGTGFQLDLNRYRTDQLAYDYAKRHFNSGFTIQYMHFSHADIGNAWNLAYFLEPFLIERNNFSLRMRVAGGLNLASNPYDELTNPDNDAYSSPVNGYLGLGFSANYQFKTKVAFFLNATYGHFSNGNTKNPNAGLNYPNIGIGLEYKFKNIDKPLGKLLFYPERWRFDLATFLCNKSLPFFPKERFWTYGLNTQASYRIGKINALTMGLEAYVDESMRKSLNYSNVYGPQHLDNRLIGLLAGHEFLFNRCIFSQQLGVYVYKEVPGKLINRVYHRWGFNYKLSRNIMVGINLNANLQKAFIFDGRLIFSLYK